METFFPKNFFEGNRSRLSKLFIGTAPILITANGLIQSGGDNTLPFKQDASFWYLTGLDIPDAVLVIDKNQEYLIVPSRSVTRQNFDGAIDPDYIKARSGINEIYDEKAGWAKLKGRIKKVKHVATLPAPKPYLETFGFYTNPARANLNLKLKNLNPNLKFLDLTQQLTKMRSIKQPEELRAIAKAIDITIKSLNKACSAKSLKTAKNEYEIEATLTFNMRRLGADGHGFEPIVAGGPNATTLHNTSNDSPIKPGELLLIDCGALVEHYTADLTRTYGVNATKRQRDIYASVKEVQEFGINLLKPGLSLKDYEQEVENFMGEQLRELGLIKSINRENVRKYYPHATSHFLGLNVHDIGDYNQPLAPGNVLTVEPGIYIREEGIGIRIEDDVLITPSGNKLLSKKLAKNL
ncbi:MAG TPA: Xaa-Pro aminopeptidase [Candidatus Sulfotelmatobacter sp.]|nr:Xaa-Pro aminopeptidase [Candidatus Sulfotelmatobacter sp.]